MKPCRVVLAALVFLASLVSSVPLVLAQAPANSPLYLDPSKPFDQRADDLIGRMTLEEKASQLVNQARAIPRLQIPAYDWWSEALHGVANAGTATVFPEPVGLAATFDTPLIHEMAVVIGTEARAKHHQAVRAGRRDIMEGLDFWSPNVNIFRDPRWGRGQETYGEDPFLTAQMGVAFVTGLQGEDPKYYRVISTPKHFAVHSGPEPTRHSMNIEVSKHDMADTYLPAFRATVVDGKAASVMCAYNRVNAEPACANEFLLVDQLRKAWKFQGYVVSDCGAVTDMFYGHHYTASLEGAAAASMKRGMDNECADFFSKMNDNSDYVRYINAVNQGLLSEKEIDLALKRLFIARFRLGMFDPPSTVAYAQTPESEIDSQPHRELALKAARESIVLLKNDGVLPLAANAKRILVAGPLAESHRVLEGNYNGTPSRSTSAIEGIRQQFKNAKIDFVPGMNFLREKVVIPTDVLSSPDGKPGLKAEYFADEKFSGTPAVVRVDPYVDLQPFHPDAAAIPVPREVNNYAVRWTGFLTPKESGEYEIGLTGSKNRLWIDDKLVVDDLELHNPVPSTIPMQLQKGRRYAIRIEYMQGGIGTKFVWLPLIADPLGDAVEAAKQADVVIAVVGITSQLEGEEMKVNVPGFQGGDRTSLDLPKEEEELVIALGSTGKPLVVVLMNGSALAVNWAKQHASAILDAWYAGEEGGTAIAQTLAGENNPAGRLPVTFYKGVEQLPPFDDYSMKNRTYRYFDGQPLYPFGYGLSFSKFEYSNARLAAQTIKAGDSIAIEADVKNVSQRAGDEVAQLYLKFPNAPGVPLRALRGFTRVHIDAGATKHIRLSLTPRDLSYVDPEGDHVITAGTYSLSIGGGQPGTEASFVEVPLVVTGNVKLPD